MHGLNGSFLAMDMGNILQIASAKSLQIRVQMIIKFLSVFLPNSDNNIVALVFREL